MSQFAREKVKRPVWDAGGGAVEKSPMPRHSFDVPASPLRFSDGRIPVQRKDAPDHPNGLPPALRRGTEALSGIAMHDVRVRRNSVEPEKIGALAYARGTEIHLGPGQEKHLPHEAWHVVQQKQGRVRTTTQIGGASVNDDAGLESEADAMDASIVKSTRPSLSKPLRTSGSTPQAEVPTQRVRIESAYDPKHPGRKNPGFIETNEYTIEELIHIFTSKKNIPFLSKEYKETLYGELNRRVEELGFTRYFHKEPELAASASKTIEKYGFKFNHFKDAAKEILNVVASLDASLKSQKRGGGLDDYDLDPRVIISAKSVLSGGDYEQLHPNVHEVIKYMGARKSADEEQRQMDALRSRYRDFVIVCSYFASEISSEEKSTNDPEDKNGDSVVSSRDDFLELVARSRESVDNAQGSVEELKNLIESSKDEILKKAQQIVESRRGAHGIPEKFEDTFDPNYRDRLHKTRRQINEMLAKFTPDIENVMPGAKLKYRGSLTDGIRNYTKSKSTPAHLSFSSVGETQVEILDTSPDFFFGGFGTFATVAASRVDLKAYDIDAFVEIPGQTWETWTRASLIPDRKNQKIKGKLLLEDWRGELLKKQSQIEKAETVDGEQVHLVRNLIDQVKTLIEIQNTIKIILKEEFEGYKKKEDVAEFDMVLQPATKTKKAETLGKPYPVGQLSRSGSAYEELLARYERLSEDGFDGMASYKKEVNVTVESKNDK